jgi:hypothetical protein
VSLFFYFCIFTEAIYWYNSKNSPLLPLTCLPQKQSPFWFLADYFNSYVHICK